MENLKYFRKIILGHHTTVYTYHKNLKFENITTKRVPCWRLMLEEYVPEIKYIKEPDNDAADALSMLPLVNYDVKEINITREHLSEIYCVNKLDSNKFPLEYQKIDKYQLKEKIW